MGYRAHTVTQQREYGSTLYFRHEEFARFYDDMEEKYSEQYFDFYRNEEEDFFEIPTEALREELKALELLPDDENCKYSHELTNGQLIETLTTSLKESKNFGTVSWEWF